MKTQMHSETLEARKSALEKRCQRLKEKPRDKETEGCETLTERQDRKYENCVQRLVDSEKEKWLPSQEMMRWPIKSS